MTDPTEYCPECKEKYGFIKARVSAGNRNWCLSCGAKHEREYFKRTGKWRMYLGIPLSPPESIVKEGQLPL